MKENLLSQSSTTTTSSQSILQSQDQQEQQPINLHFDPTCTKIEEVSFQRWHLVMILSTLN